MFLGNYTGKLMAAGAWGQSAMNWVGASPWRMAGAAVVGAGAIGALSPWNSTGGGITGAVKGGITGGLIGGLGMGGYQAYSGGINMGSILGKARIGGMWGAAAGAVLGAALWSNSAPNKIQGMY